MPGFFKQVPGFWEAEEEERILGIRKEGRGKWILGIRRKGTGEWILRIRREGTREWILRILREGRGGGGGENSRNSVDTSDQHDSARLAGTVLALPAVSLIN